MTLPDLEGLNPGMHVICGSTVEPAPRPGSTL